MRILLQTLGTRGDVQPFIALGVRLKARGHEVTVSTGLGFENEIEAAGLAAEPIGVDFRALLQTAKIKEAMRTFRGKVRAWRESGDMTARQCDDQWEIGLRLRPDLIVYNPKAFLAPWIAREVGARAAVPAVMQPIGPVTGDFPMIGLPRASFGRAGNRLSHRLANALISLALRRALGVWRARRPEIDIEPSAKLLRGYLASGGIPPRLHAYSRHLVPRPGDWNEAERVTGYWFGEPGEAWEPPEALARFLQSGPPPVYVGFGSMTAPDAEDAAALVVEALRMAGRRGIVATGWGALRPENAGEDIHVIDGAPHDWLFRRCAAVVHHGGAGTTHEGLRWGRPSVVCPVFGDQPFWGHRVAASGAGPTSIPASRLSSRGLAAAIEAALSPTMCARARSIGEAIRSEAGAESAAAVLEGCV